MSDTKSPPEQALDLTSVEDQAAAPSPAAAAGGLSKNMVYAGVAFCACVTVASVASMTALALRKDGEVVMESPNAAASAGDAVAKAQPVITVVVDDESKFPTIKPPAGENPCAGTKVDLANVECVATAMTNVIPQSGANVTKGYVGGMEVDHEPITTPYWQNQMCPVNVHWHLGTEHYSAGQYDENGKGPENYAADNDRRLGVTDVRGGYRCQHYDADVDMFNKPYVWEHCVGMTVGETYEVHWPHSARGACGTPNQFQTPFYDGVFCTAAEVPFTALNYEVGVQAQVFTIVNDESYYYPDLMRGMVVDGEIFGTDMAIYTGSTTGTSRDNEICSQYAPITWQVDRTCHMISASSFDKMCADMKSQRDDMSDDLYAHGSRILVDDSLTADNQQNRH